MLDYSTSVGLELPPLPVRKREYKYKQHWDTVIISNLVQYLRTYMEIKKGENPLKYCDVVKVLMHYRPSKSESETCPCEYCPAVTDTAVPRRR